MNLELKSVLDLDLAQVIDVLNRGFADYFVPIELDVVALLHMVRQDSVDLGASRVVQCDGQDVHRTLRVGVALIARRGWNSRLAGMALVPEARNSGVGTWLMAQLIEEARARGERSMVLEVIEGNEPGVRLYEKSGFRVVRRLVSYVAAGPEGVADPPDLQEVDVREVARLVTAYGLPDLPWQVSGEALAQMGPPGKAYQMDDAYVAISDPDAPHVGVRAVLVEPEARRQGQATRLLRAVMARHPGRTWHVPALCPEELAPLFEGVGFERGEMSQWQMMRVWAVGDGQ